MFYKLQGDQKTPVSAKENTRLLHWRTSTFWVMLVGYVGYYICHGNLGAARVPTRLLLDPALLRICSDEHAIVTH